MTPTRTTTNPGAPGLDSETWVSLPPRLPNQPPRPNPRSIALILLAWFLLQFLGIYRPPLLDDVDSVYLEVAREMLHRHDFVTPYIDGIRFFDKPPLMYWLAAASMHLFGEHDWAARLPLTLAVLALFLSIYALGRRFFNEKGALYSTLIFATALGPYLYTRFFIPDLLLCLWMTLGVHTFLIALDRAAAPARTSVPHSSRPHRDEWVSTQATQADAYHSPLTTHHSHSPLLPTLAFAAILALNLLTKGLIGLVFPLAFVALYLTLTHQWPLTRKLPLLPALATFLAVALPWHVLAALRNPAIPMPPGLGLPAKAGWAWFYLYNEHIARFLGRRIPHDYGNTPVWLFWLYTLIWMFPWVAFLPAALRRLGRHLGHRDEVTIRQREAALAVTLWSLTVLLFFTLSSRQEYYNLPALPALALLLGGTLAACDEHLSHGKTVVVILTEDSTLALVPDPTSRLSKALGGPFPTWNGIMLCHRYLLLPLATLLALLCLFFALTAPHPAPGADLSTLLSQNPDLYNLSLGHLFDLTGAAMGLFRGPLLAVALGMLTLGPASYLLRAKSRLYAANLTLAAGMTLVLLAAHEGLVRFNPILGSEPLAQAILTQQSRDPQPNDLIAIDGELTAGSTLLFYTRQPVHLVNGRVNGPWFGSFFPDSLQIFETDATLHQLWSGPRRIFLLTYAPAARTRDLTPYAPVHTLATAGGKTILTNR